MELSTIVVFPYHSSTQSGALQVAYTFGRPVIASDIGGLAEVVEDGKTGYLVPPRKPDKIAKKILEMLNSPQTRETMGEYARDISEKRFSWNPIAQKITGVYDQLLQT